MKALGWPATLAGSQALPRKKAENFVARLGIGSSAKVLDVACGTGNTAIPAARTGAEVAGVDIAPNLLTSGRQARRGREPERAFEEGDAENLPFPDHSFDVGS